MGGARYLFYPWNMGLGEKDGAQGDSLVESSELQYLFHYLYDIYVV